MDYLVVSKAEKYFGSFHALRDISLSVRRGEFVCFLGPSGCGKTTLLRAIAGLEPLSSGRLVQDDRDISDLPPSQRDFGIVFQSYALFPNLTVRDNVAFGLHSQRLARATVDLRVEEMIRMVGISDHAAKYPAQLSGGQQQRVAIARALAMKPGLLLLDEPLSALDARVRVRLREELHDLQRRVGITTIMVTHDQDEALSLADRIVVMNAGRVEQFAIPEEIYARPANRFVADFVGEMTLLEGQAETAGIVRCGNTTLRLPPGIALTNGQPVTLGIRPEDLHLAPADRDDAENALPASVAAVEFSGAAHVVRLVVPALGGTVLRARLLARDMASLDLAEGSQIRAMLPAKSLHVFPAEGAVK